ncbi:hypothetical protein MMC10_005153 [Thelotrema lepadinum]|nr:hypothetical protein [Thelotrema lepadinum]
MKYALVFGAASLAAPALAQYYESDLYAREADPYELWARAAAQQMGGNPNSAAGMASGGAPGALPGGEMGSMGGLGGAGAMGPGAGEASMGAPQGMGASPGYAPLEPPNRAFPNPPGGKPRKNKAHHKKPAPQGSQLPKFDAQMGGQMGASPMGGQAGASMPGGSGMRRRDEMDYYDLYSRDANYEDPSQLYAREAAEDDYLLDLYARAMGSGSSEMGESGSHTHGSSSMAGEMGNAAAMAVPGGLEAKLAMKGARMFSKHRGTNKNRKNRKNKNKKKLHHHHQSMLGGSGETSGSPLSRLGMGGGGSGSASGESSMGSESGASGASGAAGGESGAMGGGANGFKGAAGGSSEGLGDTAGSAHARRDAEFLDYYDMYRREAEAEAEAEAEPEAEADADADYDELFARDPEAWADDEGLELD